MCTFSEASDVAALVDLARQRAARRDVAQMVSLVVKSAWSIPLYYEFASVIDDVVVLPPLDRSGVGVDILQELLRVVDCQPLIVLLCVRLMNGGAVSSSRPT